MKYERLSDRDFVEIYSKVPRAGVDVLIVNEDGFLLTKRSIPPFKGMWHIPGGSIRFKEPIMHAINRVVVEELGIKARTLKQLGMIEYLTEGNRHTICSCHLAEIESGDLGMKDQGEEYRFFKKIPKNTIPAQEEFIKKHLLDIERYVTKK